MSQANVDMPNLNIVAVEGMAHAVARAVLAFALIWTAFGCTSTVDCSLNGLCVASQCVCDSPWVGTACDKLGFAVTPASGRSLWNVSDVRNTWNGPIMQGADGKFHIFVPIYVQGSLSKATSTKHGVADVVTGPWDWTSQPDLQTAGAYNPAAVVFPGVDGAPVYSLWLGGSILAASTPYGPFTAISGATYVGGNPAPIYHNGAFYMTNQATEQVFMTPKLGSPWSVFANISHAALPTDQYHVEDPYLWIDKRGNWHIINHAYSNLQYNACATSYVSSHFFSTDGKDWAWSSQPYPHEVQYDDGTSHIYTTLERPSLVLDASGVPTHITLAADLIIGDEGCGNRTSHAHNGHTPCDNCERCVRRCA